MIRYLTLWSLSNCRWSVSYVADRRPRAEPDPQQTVGEVADMEDGCCPDTQRDPAPITLRSF